MGGTGGQGNFPRQEQAPLTSSLLPQSLPWDRVHGRHQGAGPAVAGDDPAGAQTVLVRSRPGARPSPRLTALPPRASSCAIREAAR